MTDAIGLNEYARSQAGRVGVKIQFDLRWAKTNVRNLIRQRRYLTIANSEPLAKSPRRGTAIRELDPPTVAALGVERGAHQRHAQLGNFE